MGNVGDGWIRGKGEQLEGERRLYGGEVMARRKDSDGVQKNERRTRKSKIRTPFRG